MELHYPPVGIAHLLNEVTDLFQDRLEKVKKVQVTCISQPKTDPHFGTIIVLLSTFALAKRLSQMYNIQVEVLIDSLENSPAEEIVIKDIVYTKCLSHVIVDDMPMSEKNLIQIKEIANWASLKSAIPFRVRSYQEIQSDAEFRKGLKHILNNKSSFLSKMSPSEQILKIRPICSVCGLLEKEAKTVNVNYENGEISFLCPNHGKVSVLLDNALGIIDCNTPIRTVLRSVCFIHNKRTNNQETIIVNGGDWAGSWMQRVYFDSLSLFSFTGTDIPFNIFTPQVLDWSGAKLSKTIYLGANAYKDIDKAWLSASAFRDKFGFDGLESLNKEIESWIINPKKFFRNYSVEYFTRIIS